MDAENTLKKLKETLEDENSNWPIIGRNKIGEKSRREETAMQTLIIFEPGECYKELPDFYSMIAKALHLEMDAKSSFDCRKIRVTRDVQDEIFDYYRREKKYSDSELCFLWVNCGPKADLKVKSTEENHDYWLMAEIVDGFIS